MPRAPSIAPRSPPDCLAPTPGTIPEQHFGEAALNLSETLGDALDHPCFSFGSIWMHSRSSDAYSSNMEDYVAPRALAVRSCAASGTKFHDLNGDGSRDRGEPGLPRWMIWADYDNDGLHDTTEPFGLSGKLLPELLNARIVEARVDAERDCRGQRGEAAGRPRLASSRARRRTLRRSGAGRDSPQARGRHR
jgi:hypothetical protein